jgi:hypothetical protein
LLDQASVSTNTRQLFRSASGNAGSGRSTRFRLLLRRYGSKRNLLVLYEGGTRLAHDLARKLTPDCASSLSPKVKAEILGNDHERAGQSACFRGTLKSVH